MTEDNMSSSTSAIPYGWLTGSSTDCGPDFSTSYDYAKRECDEHNAYERSRADFIATEHVDRVPVPLYEHPPASAEKRISMLEEVLRSANIEITEREDGSISWHRLPKDTWARNAMANMECSNGSTFIMSGCTIDGCNPDGEPWCEMNENVLHIYLKGWKLIGPSVEVPGENGAENSIVPRARFAPVQNVVGVLKDLLKLAEEYEVALDYETGGARSLSELEDDDSLSEEILAARAAVADLGRICPASAADSEDAARMDWLVQQIVEVREELRYGSKFMFISQAKYDDEQFAGTTLREQIDTARNKKGSPE